MDKDKRELEEFVIKAIKRTFVSALANIELLNLPSAQFQTIRYNILRQGNSEIRLVKQEFKNYKMKRTGNYKDFIVYDGEDGDI